MISAGSLRSYLGLYYLPGLVILLVVLVDYLRLLGGCVGPNLHWAAAAYAFLWVTAIFVIDHVPYHRRLHFSSILRQLLLALEKGVWETYYYLLIPVWHMLDNSYEFLVANKLSGGCVIRGIFFLVQVVISVRGARKVRCNFVANHSCVVQVWRGVRLVHQITLVGQFTVVVLVWVILWRVKPALVSLLLSLG